ncbi:uncharacterized protein [Triticum aestivum]|uniref:uncharacterized protein n=1 Tax=Triticum aestivum TaxID=4565 RepID=UPI001D01C21F|nr:uncharacterized protein LOC123175983 [Triticum aestivum]
MEPATKNDLKDLMKELLKELKEDIKEAVAEAFGNSKPALDHAFTPAASQLLPTDAPASPTTTVDVVPVLPTSSASAKPVDIDATGIAAPTPTTCSTDGHGNDTGGDGFMGVSVLVRDTIHPSSASPEASPTLPCQLFIAIKLDTKYINSYAEPPPRLQGLISTSLCMMRECKWLLYAPSRPPDPLYSTRRLLSPWHSLLPASAPKPPWLLPGRDLTGESYSHRLPSRRGLVVCELIICNGFSEKTTATKSKVIQSNLSSSPNSINVNGLFNVYVMWCIDRGFLRIKKWRLDIHCSWLISGSFEASFWPEQHITGNYLQVLVTGSLLQLFLSGSTPISLLEDILVLSCRSIGLSVEELSEATYSRAISLYVAYRQWIISWLEGSFWLTKTCSSLQEERITYSCAKIVTTRLLVSAKTECLDSLLLIHAYLGGVCGLKWDIHITLVHATKWSSSLHSEKLYNPSSFWSESTLCINQFKELLCHMNIFLACMPGEQPIVLLPDHWFVTGMEHLQVLHGASGFPWYYYLGTLHYLCRHLATKDTTGFLASCSNWMSEVKNLVSYGVQLYTVNDFSEWRLRGPTTCYPVLINFWAMGTGYFQILQQLGNIEPRENQISKNIDEQWPGQLVFLCLISDGVAYCLMADSHSVGLVLSSVIFEVVVPPVEYAPRLLCMQPITHNLATDSK